MWLKQVIHAISTQLSFGPLWSPFSLIVYRHRPSETESASRCTAINVWAFYSVSYVHFCPVFFYGLGQRFLTCGS